MLKLTAASPYSPTPTEVRAVKDNIALKSHHKHVHGSIFKPMSTGQTVTNFFAVSRGPAVMASAYNKSKHHVQAAIFRTNAEAEQKSTELGRPLSCDEYDKTVWNSGGVQKRLARQDWLRYADKSFYAEGSGASGRNRIARAISRVAHFFHGICEMNSAPTGMALNCTRAFAIGNTDEKSLRNKAFMVGTLPFIGAGYSNLLGYIRSESLNTAAESSKVAAKFLAKGVLDALIAFPAVSASMGVLGTLAGVVSQTIVEKQALSQTQKEILSKSLTADLQKLVHLLNSIKGKQQQIEVVGKAMQGRYHVMQKIKSKDCDENGVPNILNVALEAVDSGKTETENLNTLKTALGQHLQVEKSPRENSNLWKRYMHAKQITSKECEYVALMSLVDHSRLKNPHGELQKDLRKHVEGFVPPVLRNLILKSVAYPALAVDKLLGTNAAGTLRNWVTPEYVKKQAQKLADPTLAQKNRYNAEYMTKHIHQYKFATRCLIKLSEALRLTAMNVVLARNANLSRAFANTAATIQRTLGTGPASRSMCQSIGRSFGGAALACLFAFGIPAAANTTGHGYSLDMGKDVDASVSAVSAGTMMFLLSVPSFALMSAAILTAKLEGWKGNVTKQVPKDVKTYEM